ncbi:hypothetical protein M0R19_07390 [Candidatus Pacearchaeota archaeon]|jgi:RNase P subunit RPR2|nr:hypothetical protein [Candidatus Pacearchaeota archaeon]
MKKLSKTETTKEIKDFFEEIKNKSPREIKKIKKLAMSQNIPLKGRRKLFCKKCYSPNLKVKSIKNKIKTVECLNCNNLMRWKIKD